MLASLGTKVSYGVTVEDNLIKGQDENNKVRLQEQVSTELANWECSGIEESNFQGIEEEVTFKELVEIDNPIKTAKQVHTVTCDLCQMEFSDERAAKRHQIFDRELCLTVASKNEQANLIEAEGREEPTGNPTSAEEERGIIKESGSDSRCSKCNLVFSTAKALENHRTFDKALCMQFCIIKDTQRKQKVLKLKPISEKEKSVAF